MNLIDLMKSCALKIGMGVLYERYVHICEARAWIRKGRNGSPPHLIKQWMIRAYGRKFRCKVLVETGTYQGEMINAMKSDFDELHSIELSRDLFEKASAKFATYPHIHLYNGDSAEVLQNILQKLHQPALFWLDAHYSAGFTAKGNKCTPIEEELDQVFKHECAGSHVVLVDDARTFNGKNDYPTLENLEVISRKAGYRSFSVADDVIRICNPV